MDDMFSSLLGPAQAQSSSAPSSSGFDPTKTYGTPSRMLDNLVQVESTNGKNLINPTTGAMGPYQFLPSTVAMLKKQGVTFDPMDMQQSRAAADYYIQQLKQQNGGTYQGALKAYGGFKNTPPTSYINKVMAGVPTTPGQSNPGDAPQSAPVSPANDMFSVLLDPQSKKAQAPQAPQAPAPQTGPSQETNPLSKFGHSAIGLADTALSAPGAVISQGEYAVRRALGQSPQQATQGAQNGIGSFLSQPVAKAYNGLASLFGDNTDVRNTAGYQNEASQRAGRAVGGAIERGSQAVANATGLPAQDVSNMAQTGLLAVPAVVKGLAPVGRALGIGEEAGIPSAAGAIPSGAGGRGSMGAAGTNFADQAAAEGVPQAIVSKIAAAEQNGTINATAAGRHIEAGSLPVPVELTAGQASGDIHLLSNEQNMRAKNPALGDRFNAQNGQINDNLTAIRDQVSPDVNVPSGAPTGQAIVDAYKEMDAPIRQNITELYAKARGNDGAPALVDAAPQMAAFEKDIGPTRFNALPARVQQIFTDAKNNVISLPAAFDQSAGSTRPMTVSDLMDIDKTLSGALADVKDGSVRHDIGVLRDRIIGSDLDPSSAGTEAFTAYKDAQAAARTRFQAMDADPAYKAAVNDAAGVGEPSALADDFVRKYVAGGKTANVQNMMRNLSNEPSNAQLVASGLMDHIRAQAGVDLRTGTGNISQAGLNKAIVNQGDKLSAVLGPQASQTLEKLGNVARYTQEQPRGSYVNNSNTAVTLMGHAGNLAKSAIERGVNAVVPGAGLGSWGREALAASANAKNVRQSLELGAGLSQKGLDRLR